MLTLLLVDLLKLGLLPLYLLLFLLMPATSATSDASTATIDGDATGLDAGYPASTVIE